MTVRIVISTWPGERRFARIAGGRVAAIRVMRDHGGPYVGAVYLGRVLKVDPGIRAAFVDIGLEQPGFLNLGKKNVTEGQAVAVLVKADPQAEKGARLSLDLPKDLMTTVPEGSKPPLLLRPVADPLVELESKGPADEILENKPGQADDPFDSLGAAEALEAALCPLVGLPSGGRLMIERTAALWAVDVDTGAQKGPDGRFRANQEAALALARQIRLRNLGGRILVDFAGLARTRLDRVVATLKAELAQDEVPVHVGGVTPLGLVELVRERRTPCLADLFQSPQALACEGLRQALGLVRATPRARPRLRLPRAAFDLLKGPMLGALRGAEQRLGLPITLEIGEKLEVLDS
jgi:Ribonuclease G/E